MKNRKKKAKIILYKVNAKIHKTSINYSYPEKKNLLNFEK